MMREFGGPLGEKNQILKRQSRLETEIELVRLENESKGADDADYGEKAAAVVANKKRDAKAEGKGS